MRFGSSRAVSEGVRSSATRITGSLGNFTSPCCVPVSNTQDALPDVVQIGGAPGEPLVLHLLDFGDALIDHLLPRPGGAVAGLDQLVDFAEEIDVGQKGLVGAEDGGFVAAAARFHCVVDFGSVVRAPTSSA